KDENHLLASHIMDRLLDERPNLITSNDVLVETTSLLQARYGIGAVHRFWELVNALVEVHWIDDELHKVAIDQLFREGRRELGLVDCVSFEVMRRLQIHEAFAFDRHFTEQGFRCLTA